MKISELPLCLFDANFGALTAFLDIVRVILFIFFIRVNIFAEFPEFLGTQLEIVMRICLVPEDLFVQFIRFGVIINDQTLIILCALVHHLTKGLECGEHTSIILINTLSIGNVWFSQNKNIIYVGSQCGWYTQRILHCDD